MNFTNPFFPFSDDPSTVLFPCKDGSSVTGERLVKMYNEQLARYAALEKKYQTLRKIVVDFRNKTSPLDSNLIVQTIKDEVARAMVEHKKESVVPPAEATITTNQPTTTISESAQTTTVRKEHDDDVVITDVTEDDDL